MRRAAPVSFAVVALLASACLAATAPAASGAPRDERHASPSSPLTPNGAGDARTRRAALLERIADLTDSLHDAQVDRVAADLGVDELEAQVRRTRERIRARVVAAYVRGLDHPGELAVPAAYLRVAQQKERARLATLKQASAALSAKRAAVDAAHRELSKAAVELDAARAELDVLVAEEDARLEAAREAAREAAQEAAERKAAADARRQAQAAAATAAAEGLARARSAGDAGAVAAVPRHARATRAQQELMARYPFGVLPPSGLPSSLRATGQTFSGLASWYGGEFNGRPTASGAIYDQELFTAASRTLPLGTLLVVTRNGVRVLVLVNDRGPYIDGRVLDLSAAAARALGVGVSAVDAEVVVPA